MSRVICTALALLGLTLFAGGPIDRAADGTPSRHDISKPLVYNLDPGELNATFSHAQVKSWVQAEFNDWQNIPGTSLTITEGEEFGEDITSLDQLNNALNAGQNPVGFDETGSIYEDFGLEGSGVLAFAATVPAEPQNGTYFGMFAVIGGQATTNASEDALRSTILHEIGHALGLGHSVVGGALFEAVNEYHEFGTVPAAAVETMYFRETFSSTHELKQDDISGYLELYGTTAQGNAQSGAISGTIYMADGGEPADGVNVIVHDRSGGRDTVFVNSASTISWGNNVGRYQILGLPPGEYSVEVYDIGRSAGGRYSQPIRTNFDHFLDPDNTFLGDFPGVAEFYNTGESHRPELDDPDAFTTVTVTAGATQDGIDILFNRDANVKGTVMTKTYHVPEVQTSGDASTYVGIVNPGSSQVQVEITGFGADGAEIVPDQYLVKIPALGKLDLDVATWFGAEAGNVAWIQVGGPSKLYVYGELQTPETRGAWWSNDGLSQQVIMPHVAKDTGSFETTISSVNGKDEVRATNLVSQPGDVSLVLNGHENPFGQASTDLLSLFGDLNGVEWARLQSDEAVTASMEYFVGPPETRSQMAALGLTNESGTLLRFLHIANNLTLYWTGLVYINTSEVSVTATETYYNSAGAVVNTVNQELTPGQKIVRVLRAGFDPEVFGINPESTWMEVSIPEESGGQLVGYELFSTPDPTLHDIFTGLQGNYAKGRIIDYPHFQTGSEGYTAIVATNVGGTSAHLTVELFSNDGTLIASKQTDEIGPKSKLAIVVNAGYFGLSSVAEGAWIRATASGSNWAGFTLWGDSAVEPEVPKHLSGINAALSGDAPEPTGPARQLIDETSELHNSYASAQVLSPTDGIWNINVVGKISQSDPNDQIVNAPYFDGIEDVYTFTLSEPTTLLIAANPNNPLVDLDLIVVNNEMANGDFYPDDYPFNLNLDYSATFSGLESVARVFQPGTYYILVTHYAGDLFEGSYDYGLLLTAHPLLLETFDDETSLDGWVYLLGGSDTDDFTSWGFSDQLRDTKYGPSLLNFGPEEGGLEDTVAQSPSIYVPGTGTTVYDFDYGGIGTEFTNNDNMGSGVFTEENQLVSTGPSWVYGTEFPVDMVSSGGFDITMYRWRSWTTIYQDDDEGYIVDYTFAENHLMQNLSIGLWGRAEKLDWAVDNLRVYNMVTTMDESKRKAPGRLARPVKKSKKLHKGKVRKAPSPVEIKRTK